MDVQQYFEAIATINNLSTVASVSCVVPTYFLRLQPTAYRIVLSLGILLGLSPLLFAMTTIFWPLPGRYSQVYAILPVVFFSPLVTVLIVMLARIRSATPVALWSTVVLVCVIVDWLEIYRMMLIGKP